MNKKIIRVAALIFALAWMAVIFIYSSQEAEVSGEASRSVSYVLVDSAQNIFGLGWDEERIEAVSLSIEWCIRKIAHMTEYAILAFLLGVALDIWRYVRITDVPLKIKFRPACVDTAVCVLYACSDEYHQTFVAGRTGKVRDVFVDLGGVLACIALTWLIVRLYRKKRLGK